VIFPHDDPEFGDLVSIVAGERHLGRGLVEKDYWVTHTLRALHDLGLAIWFKGGTSLSKGFGLIERFSEDLDLKVEPGRVAGLPGVGNWRSEGAVATRERAAFYAALAAAVKVPGATVRLADTPPDRAWRNAELRVEYTGIYRKELEGSAFRPFVLLEIGSARVTPFVERDLSSFVHEALLARGQLGSFLDNRAHGVRCVHPLVTLLEKLDAIGRRHPRPDAPAATFVRHYEDAARIIRSQHALPPLAGYPDVRALAAEMLDQRQLSRLPAADDPAFALGAGARSDELRRAHEVIAPMFWGARIGLEEACAEIRGWASTLW
jgi:hypothetical protein